MKNSSVIFKNLVFVLLFLATSFANAQTNTSSNSVDKINIDDIKRDTLQSDFQLIFNTNDDKTNFKKLRDYLQKKQTAIDQVQAELPYYSDLERNITTMMKKSKELDDAIATATKASPQEASIDIYFQNCDINLFGTTPTPLKKLKDTKNNLATCIADENKRQTEFNILKLNLNVLKSDLTLCQDQLDSTLGPEYKDQEFRKVISIGFACLLGGLLLVFIVVVMRSQKNIADYFFSDTGLQFITLFILIISITLFGILKILEGRELAAILSGIAGYILGKSKVGVSTGKENQSPVIQINSNDAKADDIKDAIK